VSFRREKFVPFGGPDGGDGGDGGSVTLRSRDGINTLADFRIVRTFRAENGQPGGGKDMTGRGGSDTLIEVPVGTIVRDSETGEVLGDLRAAGMELLVARGGKGGWGNQRFKSSKNRSPRQYGPGLPGEIARARLELKVIADVGLLGLPNAGKSTLISACPRRGPRSPTIRSPRCIRTWAWSPAATSAASSWPTSRASSKVPRMAPASASVSCKHLQRTRVLLHLVDIAPVDPNADPVRDARSIVGELGKFSEDLLAKPRWLVLNKSDCMPRMKRARRPSRSRRRSTTAARRS
jgi:GTP-binding protein